MVKNKKSGKKTAVPARAKHTATKRPARKSSVYDVRIGERRIRVILDKVLIFRFTRSVHGRFWGMAAITTLTTGFIICFMIRPDLVRFDTAFSDFGTDVRTAPYFAGSVFFGAYGLWRWRNYLHNTWTRDMPILFFLTLTIFGLYLTALMPIVWRPWPYRIHLFGISMAFISMILTVIFDGLLTRTRRGESANRWRALRLLSAALIIAGGYLTLGSSEPVQWFHVSLVGELMIWVGYGLWIGFKTYQGEGTRSKLSRLASKFVLID